MLNTIYSDKIKVNCPLIHDKDGYYHLIYCITNKKNGKIYIGKHSTKNPYDKYMGSGINIGRAIKKYGIDNFTKEILFCFDKEDDAFLKEEEIVTQEFIDRKDTYNMRLGGKGFSSKDMIGEKNPNYGKSPSKETRDKISNALKGKFAGKNNPNYGRTGEKHPMYGKHLNQETKDKLSKSLKGRPSPQKGKHPSQKTLDKMSKAHVGKKHKPETLKKMSDAQSGERNPMYGRSGERNPMYGVHRYGAKNPRAKVILKLDEFGNIITEYGCINDCCNQENISRYKLNKSIKEHTLYNGFYFMFKIKP